jgi:hypothetical protein
VHVAFSYLVRGGQKLRKDTKTHQDRYLAIDPVTVDVLAARKQQAQAALSGVGVAIQPDAYVFSSDPLGATPWNPDWVTHKVAQVAAAAGVKLTIKALRHYSASQLLAGGIDLRNTAARLGHGADGATTLRHTPTRYRRWTGGPLPTWPGLPPPRAGRDLPGNLTRRAHPFRRGRPARRRRTRQCRGCTTNSWGPTFWLVMMAVWLLR